jgi:hypothetical protein
MVIDAHGEQNGAIYQEVTLGRSNFTPVSMLSEESADVLERLINSKHRNHSSHLHLRLTTTDARPGQGLWSSLRAACLAVKISVSCLPGVSNVQRDCVTMTSARSRSLVTSGWAARRSTTAASPATMRANQDELVEIGP